MISLVLALSSPLPRSHALVLSLALSLSLSFPSLLKPLQRLPLVPQINPNFLRMGHNGPACYDPRVYLTPLPALLPVAPATLAFFQAL